MNSTIIPLVKCKAGNLSDINNYRAITLSNAITKIMENVLLQYVHSTNTTLCTLSFKNTVQYYTSRCSHVFVCFADFSKAFDRVNY